MFPWLTDQFDTAWAVSLEKITLRGSLAVGLAFVLALILGHFWIRHFGRRFAEPNRSDSKQLEALHQHKDRTPTMGGLFVMAAVLVAILLFADLMNRLVQATLLVTVGMMAIGMIDDLSKMAGRGGISKRAKLFAQIGVAVPVALLLYGYHAGISAVDVVNAGTSHATNGGTLAIYVPMLADTLPIGWFFIPLAVLVIVGTSNAVNLTDGLDGLAGGCLLCATVAVGMIAYAAGHAEWAAYLAIPGVAGSGEMAVIATAMAGGILGFLWFNCHPAQVFMGDSGSLPLGAMLGTMAVAVRQELVLVFIGGVFVVEALSVILQIGSYRLRGRRIFLCAPLHHHFQFRGAHESRIVIRFWIASALCAILGVACLKIRIVDQTPVESPGPTHAVTQVDRTIR
ncbi:MAG: phospho-N-acetylmuramoyl-pentapeptide-transferase [Planctomycetia bacterium]|jgi:phospho-N-acetylmuramoyl-pentapeptide-transferase